MASRTAEKSRPAIEIASIAGILAVFVFAEMVFGVFKSTAVSLAATVPFMDDFGVTIFAGLWTGLAVYSLRRRSDLKRETVKRVALESDLEQAKIADPVTGLPNPKGFNLVLDSVIATRAPAAISVLGFAIDDIDTIKSVHGVKTVQRIQLAVADILCDLATDGDLVACGNGAQFYGMFADDDIAAHDARISRVIRALDGVNPSQVIADNSNLRSKLFIGVLSLHELKGLATDWSAEEIVQRVDFCVRCAERNNTGLPARFNMTMETMLRERLYVEASLDDAIANGHIVPHFQPQIDLKTNEIVGFEVLARWEKSSAGLLLPGSFIPVAEDMGVLGKLTLSILDQACKISKSWPSDFILAFNVSPKDLHDPDLIERFIKTLKDNDTDPRRIEIEITENAFIEEAENITNVITDLKNAGIAISIDDFGTGYSSLHHLRILPFDKIKIDQSFVKAMVTDVESRMIVKSIIALGDSLGLPTLAEGIEAIQNNDMLNELGCSIGQGYLFAKPLPGDQVPDFIERYDASLKAQSKAA